MNYRMHSPSYSSLQRLLPRGSQKVGEPLYLNKCPGPDCIPPRIPKELMRYGVLSTFECVFSRYMNHNAPVPQKRQILAGPKSLSNQTRLRDFHG